MTPEPMRALTTSRIKARKINLPLALEPAALYTPHTAGYRSSPLTGPDQIGTNHPKNASAGQLGNYTLTGNNVAIDGVADMAIEVFYMHSSLMLDILGRSG